MPRLKKCPDCGGKMERGRTNFITESENGLIAIENIEADICKKNGSTSGNCI
jgi:YgiT-type zinc finger domain-containing protein